MAVERRSPEASAVRLRAEDALRATQEELLDWARASPYALLVAGLAA